MTQTIYGGKVGSERLPAGHVLTATLDAGAGAQVQRIYGGSVVEAVNLSASTTYGPYLHDMLFIVSTLAGATVTLDTLPSLAPSLGAEGIAWASLPAAASWNGMVVPLADFATRPLVRSDGTAWRLLAPADLLVDFTAVTGVANTSEQILKQIAIPVGLLRALRYFTFKVLYAKSGASETATLRARLGTGGTTSDQAILTNSSTLSSTNRAATAEGSFFASSATQLRGVGRDSSFGVGGFIAGSTTTTYPTNATVPDMSANALTLSLSLQMNTGAETGTIAHVILSGA